MSNYHYRFSTQKKRQTKRVTIVSVGAVVLILVLGLAIVAVDRLMENSKEQVVTSVATKSTQGNDVNIFRTKYFQFQADESWSEIAGDTTENKYAYRSMRGSLVEHDIKIYVNAEPPDLNASRVQPVVIVDERNLSANGPISEHCSTALPKNTPKGIMRMTMAGVTFDCRSDSSTFSVIVADTKGQPSFKLKRADETVAQYVIVYRDVTANPDGRKLRQIVESFQGR